MMMKLITGFFMAWGNFLTLPCPLKRWDNDLKNFMLGFLPSVGLIIGLLWAGIALLLAVLPIPFLVTAFLLTMVPFVLSGFLHLDGFMDCCDAILSRRPLEDRQRILKDSHTGAFAVVSVVFLILGFHAFFSTALSVSIDFVDLCLIPAASRAASGLNVLLRRPMSSSQYAQGEGAAAAGQKNKAAAIIFAQLLIFSAAGLFLASAPLGTLTVIGVTFFGSLMAVAFACRQLGGMNGDIAGYGIVWGELLGVLTIAVI